MYEARMQIMKKQQNQPKENFFECIFKYENQKEAKDMFSIQNEGNEERTERSRGDLVSACGIEVGQIEGNEERTTERSKG